MQSIVEKIAALTFICCFQSSFDPSGPAVASGHAIYSKSGSCADWYAFCTNLSRSLVLLGEEGQSKSGHPHLL